MSDMLRGLSMPSRALLTRSPGKSSSASRKSPPKRPIAPTINQADDVEGCGDARTTGAVVGGAVTAADVATVVEGAGAVVVGAAVVGAVSMTSTSRPATRAKALDTPAGSSAGVTGPSAVRLARSVSAVVRLIVSMLMPCAAPIASSRVADAPLVLAVRQDHEHLVVDGRREVATGTDDHVVQRGVAVDDDRIDLCGERAPIGGG